MFKDGEQRVALAAISEQDQAHVVVFFRRFNERPEQHIHTIVGFPAAQAEQNTFIAPTLAFAPDSATDAGGNWRKVRKVNSPGENTDFLRVESEADSLGGGAVGIRDQSGGVSESKAGFFGSIRADENVVHKVETPAHAQQRCETGSCNQKSKVLQRTGMHQIRLYHLQDLFKFPRERLDVAFGKLALASAPFHHLDAARRGEAAWMQAQHETFMPAFRQGCQKPLIVHRIGTRKVQNAHQVLSKLCPAQFLPRGNILAGCKPHHLINIIRHNRAGRGRA